MGERETNDWSFLTPNVSAPIRSNFGQMRCRFEPMRCRFILTGKDYLIRNIGGLIRRCYNPIRLRREHE